MDKAEIVFEKLAFFATAPFKVDNPEELRSFKGYAKEYGNASIGSLLGSVTGGLGGAALGGATLAALSSGRRFPTHMKGVMAIPGALVGGLLGATAGSTVGGIRSQRKTQRDAGTKPLGASGILARMAATAVGAAPGAALQTYGLIKGKPGAALLGNLLATAGGGFVDYFARRELLTPAKVETNG